MYVALYMCFSFPFRIDIHFVIKIADFGLSEDVYAKNYFRQTGSDKSTKLPVKWMAPECLTDGIFSEKSDVVGFCLPVAFHTCISYACAHSGLEEGRHGFM